MGEERRLFPELQGDLSTLTAWQLQEPLEEIAAGTSSFGPLPEWREWYHYLLGRLVVRGHEAFVSSLLESLITAFMAIYPNGVHASPYPEFREDVLDTLGRCMMAPQCWSEDGITVGSMLHRSDNNPARVWRWWDASGDFSASMFFCLKYLPAQLVGTWFSSVLAIESPHWRAQCMVWLVGSHELLAGEIDWPSQLPDDAYPSIAWNWSHCLGPHLASQDDSGAQPVESFLPVSSRQAVLSLARKFFSEGAFLTWIESIGGVSYLSDELAALPSTFESLYVRADAV